MADIKTLYSERYAKQTVEHVYPVEFVVRAFLGSYPDLKLNRGDYAARSVLDLGFWRWSKHASAQESWVSTFMESKFMRR